jgi:hypothetical protein
MNRRVGTAVERTQKGGACVARVAARARSRMSCGEMREGDAAGVWRLPACGNAARARARRRALTRGDECSGGAPGEAPQGRRSHGRRPQGSSAGERRRSPR